jgi:hypothetical protein
MLCRLNDGNFNEVERYSCAAALTICPSESALGAVVCEAEERENVI